MEDTQSYENHAHHPKLTYYAFAFWLAAILCIVAGWIGHNTTNIGLVLLCLSVLVIIATGRTYTTALQDRIIRLEMRVRSQKLLSPEQFARFDELHKSQLVALRFASDQELPGLVQRALDEPMRREEIKKAVKNWVPDRYRT